MRLETFSKSKAGLDWTLNQALRFGMYMVFR